jgi:hypothetical protein
LVFTGAKQESKQEALERQEKEVKFKKTVNEIRAEDGLPPLPGGDNLILDNVYFQWYSQFSKEAQELMKQNQEMQMQQMGQQNQPDQQDPMQEANNFDDLFQEEPSEEVAKANKISVEYYEIKK